MRVPNGVELLAAYTKVDFHCVKCSVNTLNNGIDLKLLIYINWKQREAEEEESVGD